MKVRKFRKDNKDKPINTIIEIRKEILKMLRDLSKDLDRELYDSNERKKISQEVREIAEMIRDKDKYMNKMMLLEPIPRKEMCVENNLIRETRDKIRALLKYNAQNITAGKYDSEELEIIFKEIEDAKQLVYEKDRLVIHRKENNVNCDRTKVNPYLAKHFKIDLDQER